MTPLQPDAAPEAARGDLVHADAAVPVARRSAFWPCACLAAALIACKAAYWGAPEPTYDSILDWIKDVSISSCADVLFAVTVGLACQSVLWLARRRPRLERAVWMALVAFGFVSVVYAVASVQIFAYLRSPLTYPLLYLAGDMTAMRSSLGSFVNARLVTAFVAAPALYLLAVHALRSRRPRVGTQTRRLMRVASAAALVGYAAFTRQALEGPWGDKTDHLIAENPHWELVASCLAELLGEPTHPLTGPFPPEYLTDFEVGSLSAKRRRSTPARRPRNLILVVLESTGTRYLSLYGSKYDTMPRLRAESAHALVFDNFYSHVGMSANSMAAITLSIYPYMTWREYTVEYPALPGKTLADVLKPRGFRTAFLHTGDLDYVNQGEFLKGRGFDSVQDARDLRADGMVSSWGSDDRVLVDGLLKWIDLEPKQPFYAMAWTMQSHHPYEPSAGQQEVDFFKGDIPPDDYDLGRYLNTLAEVDRQLGRLFDGLRERGIADDTLVVMTGDHGEAFGAPHQTWGHGARIYEENVRVPFLIWNPRLYPRGRHLPTVASHVDVNPTIVELLGLPPPESWQGRSVFEPARPPRAYFYAANDDYLLGVREGNWKYIYNATRGRDELYDLTSDPDEQTNVADQHSERCQRLRQRLAAWRDHVGRHLAGLQRPTS